MKIITIMIMITELTITFMKMMTAVFPISIMMTITTMMIIVPDDSDDQSD